jgi:hypothetical protein
MEGILLAKYIRNFENLGSTHYYLLSFIYYLLHCHAQAFSPFI